MTIKDVESLVGITKKNIRFYERMQLLTPLRDRENSYRNYSDADVQRLKKVKLLRSLHMPIEEIRKILSGENELQACLQSHTAELCAEIDNLRCARQLCAEIERDISGDKPFCIDGYLGKLREYEKEGVKFMNIKKSDTRKKITVPILCALVMITFMAAMIGLFVWATTRQDSPPIAIVAVFIAIPAAISVGVIIALVQAIKEINKGEIDEARKY
ncbi:MAG: MerR family transcriptional regulator [Oscillospiraceae bacterium]